MLHNGRVTHRPSRWLAPLLGLLTFVVVLVGGGLVAADWQVRSSEMRALVSSIEASEAAMSETQQAVRAALAGLDGADPEADRDALDAALGRAATVGLAAVTDGGDLVAAVGVLPWHDDVREARQAYLAHNLAWQAYLERAAADPEEFGRTQDDVNRTFAEAEGPLRTAVPLFDLWDLGVRLDQVFAEPEPDPGSESGSEDGQQAQYS